MTTPAPATPAAIDRLFRQAAALTLVSLTFALGLAASGHPVAWTIWALPLLVLLNVVPLRFLATRPRLRIASSIASACLALAMLASLVMSILGRF